MHTSNVWAAWIAAGHDLLAEVVPAGLSLRDLESLTLIESHDGCSVEWLRERVALTHSGTVRLVDRLVGLGLVARDRPGGRSVALSVTAAGRAALTQWNDGRDAAMASALSGLSEADRDRLIELIAAALRSRPRPRAAADRTCRTCHWARCVPECPVDASVGD